MTEYENLEYIYPKLAENPELSDHNKKVLDDFFDKWRHKAKDSSNEDFANKWNNFAPFIDFRLDEATRDDVEKLMKKLDRDEIEKKRGGPYSPQSKVKHYKALSVFYRQFIDHANRGYNEEISGHIVVEGQKKLLSEKPTNSVKKETKPSASEVKKVASNLDKFRDRCIIIFGWSCGARVGEIFKTRYKPQPLLWEDITFNNDDTMTVHLRKNYKKELPNRRRVEVSVSKPMMKKLYKQKKPDRKDPVFVQENPTLHCPKCSGRVSKLYDGEERQPTTSYNRKYQCKQCEKVYKRNKLEEDIKSITGARVNDIIKKAVSESDIRNRDDTSHKFFRKARALQKVAMNWNDSSINGFFGWEVGSSAKKKYIEALQVSQKQDLKEEHPELDINVEGRFHDEGLKPSKCSDCGKLNSRLWDFCEGCGHELSYQGMLMTQDQPETKENEIKQKAKTRAINQLKEKSGMSDDEIKEILDKNVQDLAEEIT